ncbi:MAG TPA: hypothetical protein VD929_11365 [Caulobacteraceae bacterium]|nr:hypothetical protein [Caulobacteraceae bacterium]
MYSILALLLLLALIAVGLTAWRLADRRADERAWRALRSEGGAASAGFDPATVDGLPDPARRYFLHVIQPGARWPAWPKSA